MRWLSLVFWPQGSGDAGVLTKLPLFFTLPMIHLTLEGMWMNQIVWNSVDRSRLFLRYFCHSQGIYWLELTFFQWKKSFTQPLINKFNCHTLHCASAEAKKNNFVLAIWVNLCKIAQAGEQWKKSKCVRTKILILRGTTVKVKWTAVRVEELNVKHGSTIYILCFKPLSHLYGWSESKEGCAESFLIWKSLWS